jgi:hypothetical protein
VNTYLHPQPARRRSVRRVVAAAALAIGLSSGVVSPTVADAAPAPSIQLCAIFDGQSNTLSPTMMSAYPAKLMNTFLAGIPYMNVAVPGTTYKQRTDTAPSRVDIYPQYCQQIILFAEGGVHDILEGLNADQIGARVKTYVTGRRAAGYDAVVAATIPPSTYYTPANEAVRVAWNKKLKEQAASMGIDMVVDVAAIPQLQNPADRSMYYDGVHFTDTAAQYVAWQYAMKIFYG